jgi:hypothetical protein
VTVVVATEDELSECVALRLIGLQMGNTDGVQMIRERRQRLFAKSNGEFHLGGEARAGADAC